MDSESSSNSSMWQCLPIFTEPWDMSDVMFIVEDRPIYANRTVLAMWSPVLKAMFQGAFMERSSPSVCLPDKRFEDILELCRVLHPPNKEVNEQNVGVLLPLAREYQVDEVTKRCEQYLLCKAPSVRNLTLSEEFGLSALKHQCLDYLKRSKLKIIVAEPDFDCIENDTKIHLLMDKSLLYEKLLDELASVVCGELPEQMQFRVGGTPCTFTCSNKRYRDGPHTAGTERTCKYCALYMVKQTHERLKTNGFELNPAP